MPSLKNIDFNALRIFLAVAESKTLTEAAARLSITQSAVSQSIKQLESITGVDLVVRKSRPIRLTVAGEILQHSSEHIVSNLNSMLSEVALTSGNRMKNLRIGLIDSFADAAGQQLLEQLKVHANELALRCGMVGSLNKALLNREIDLIITTNHMDEIQHLERFPLFRDPFVILLPKKLSENYGGSVHQLARQHPFIRYNRQANVGAMTDLIARRLGIQLNINYELDSTQTLLRFVGAGHGWAMTTGLCLMQFPHLLEGIDIVQIPKGSHARYGSLICRSGELGDLPEKTAKICRNVYDNLIPGLIDIAPWLENEAYSITVLPII